MVPASPCPGGAPGLASAPGCPVICLSPDAVLEPCDDESDRDDALGEEEGIEPAGDGEGRPDDEDLDEDELDVGLGMLAVWPGDELDELDELPEDDDEDDEEDDGKGGAGLWAWGRDCCVLQALIRERLMRNAVVTVATRRVFIVTPICRGLFAAS